MYSKKGKYGGTYAHKYIEFVFVQIAKYQLNNAEKIKLIGDCKTQKKIIKYVVK